MVKIAIQGHPTRGKEVIRILESLGGVNRCPLKGNSTISHYYISYNNNNVISCHDFKYVNNHCKIYTLEEFEKDFPFKVGDLCIYHSDISDTEIVVKILGMVIKDNCIMYEIINKDINQVHSGIYKKRHTLKPYKEMKEERNITLTLDKAKEWYNKGGELKEIALQAFTEKELNTLPKSWEEFCEKFSVKNGECWIGTQDTIYSATITQDRNNKNWIPSRRSAKAHLAMIQLEQLRDCWRQGNVPQEIKYKIRKVGDKYKVVWGNEDAFLSFCDNQTAEEFLECFKDLIEQAGDLI